MARFFLMMNGERINTIDDLRKNFNPKQILACYKAKGLQRWLEEKNYSVELGKIDLLQSQDDELNLIRQMMEIFSFDKDQIEAIMSQFGKKDNYEQPQCHWSMLRLTYQDGKFISQIDSVEDNGCGEITLPSDWSIRLYGLFFYDGYFWAWCGDATELLVREKFYAIKSNDFYHWEIDDKLTEINFKWMHFFPGEKCCFLTPIRYCPLFHREKANPYYVKGEYQTWEKGKFEIDSQIPCREYEISAILANKERTGILYTGSEKIRVGGLFSHSSWDLPKSWLFLKKGADEFEKCSDDCIASAEFAFAFKNKFFIINSGRMYVSDTMSCKFSLSNCGFKPKGEEGVFPFKDILFMLDIHDELYYSSDGEKWEKSIINDRVKKIIYVDDKYFAFTENGKTSLEIMFSQDGQRWFYWYALFFKENSRIDDVFAIAGDHAFLVSFESERLYSNVPLIFQQSCGYLICDLKHE